MKHAISPFTSKGRIALSLCAAVIVAGPAASHDGTHHTVVPGDSVAWGAAPASLPSGAKAAVLFGSPAKEGPFVLRLGLPAGFVVPPHRHSKDEFVTVLSGKVAFGTGETVDRTSVEPLPEGSFIHLPAGMPHYVVTFEDTVLQLNATGPFDVIYVDPESDPRTIPTTPPRGPIN
ncbi:MAG: cupin domain-containing protein [Rhizobiaceae bacterium]|nr:cupin domain-containing protein [Rhizobiaceae bacterium]MCV0406642.1 cupin domain-containing protein [Rhizobiaceae bacterium]